MKKLIFRKVKIVKKIPHVELDDWLFRPIGPFAIDRSRPKREKKKSLAQRKMEQKEQERHVQWFVMDKSTGEELTRLDSYEQAKQYCIKNDYDFGQYL